MKKAISILLALVLCLSLCACGGGKASAEKAIIGEWKATNGDSSLIFYEDGTCVEAQMLTYKWRYDSEISKYVIEFAGTEVEFTIETENGIRSLSSLSFTPCNYVHADDYEKAVEANK